MYLIFVFCCTKINDKLRKNILQVSMYITPNIDCDCVLWFVIIDHIPVPCGFFFSFLQNFLIEAIAVCLPNEHLLNQQVALERILLIDQFPRRCFCLPLDSGGCDDCLQTPCYTILVSTELPLHREC